MLQSVVMVLVASLTQAQALDQYGDPLPTGALMRLGTTHWRHSDHCTLAAFVGDGKSAITAGYDGLVARWSVPDGRNPGGILRRCRLLVGCHNWRMHEIIRLRQSCDRVTRAPERTQFCDGRREYLHLDLGHA